MERLAKPVIVIAAEVGADLFGIYEDEVLSPEAKTSQSPVEKPKPASQKLVRTASMISPDEVPLFAKTFE